MLGKRPESSVDCIILTSKTFEHYMPCKLQKHYKHSLLSSMLWTLA